MTRSLHGDRMLPLVSENTYQIMVNEWVWIGATSQIIVVEI